VSEPQHTDAVIADKTGRDWKAWCELIESWPGHTDGHTAVATWLQSEHGVAGWWSQAITVGWERISGRRLMHQSPDGTFSATASATITVDADALREMLLDEDGRGGLFPGMDAQLRSRPTSKNIRIGFGDTVAILSVVPKGDGRQVAAVQHQKLDSPDAVTHWKKFWAEWFSVLDEGGA
jgi:hypothetical protein